MMRSLCVRGTLVMVLCIASLGCDEWLVGSPCVAETDTGEFVPLENPGATTYGLETRSVQCRGDSPMVCLTATHRKAKWEQNAGAETEYLQWKDTHTKYSFCSCRCKDSDGNKYDRNSDKYDDLCECPWSTECSEVLGKDIAAPEKVRGSYCMPDCVADQKLCPHRGERCLPSTDSDRPWAWKCGARHGACLEVDRTKLPAGTVVSLKEFKVTLGDGQSSVNVSDIPWPLDLEAFAVAQGVAEEDQEEFVIKVKNRLDQKFSSKAIPVSLKDALTSGAANTCWDNEHVTAANCKAWQVSQGHQDNAFFDNVTCGKIKLDAQPGEEICEAHTADGVLVKW
jgi:hypothetical protein